jgi:hypothetical protein
MNTDVLPYRGNPAGGGYTTVEDLWRFAVALTGLRLLDARHATMVTSGHVEAGWGGRCVALRLLRTAHLRDSLVRRGWRRAWYERRPDDPP